MTAQPVKLYLSDRIVIHIASKTAFGFRIRQRVTTTGFLDRSGPVLDLSAGVDELGKTLRFLFGK